MRILKRTLRNDDTSNIFTLYRRRLLGENCLKLCNTIAIKTSGKWKANQSLMLVLIQVSYANHEFITSVSLHCLPGFSLWQSSRCSTMAFHNKKYTFPCSPHWSLQSSWENTTLSSTGSQPQGRLFCCRTQDSCLTTLRIQQVTPHLQDLWQHLMLGYQTLTRK